MTEFFELPVRREDGSEAIQYINMDAVSCAERDATEGAGGDLRIHLNNGYWFTLSGPRADDFLDLIKGRLYAQSKGRSGAC